MLVTREPTVYDHHPHLMRLLMEEQYADLDRNVRVAEAVRTVRRARQAARRRRLGEQVARFARSRSRDVAARPSAPATSATGVH